MDVEARFMRCEMTHGLPIRLDRQVIGAEFRDIFSRALPGSCDLY
jgi:hypothetical protein